MFPAENQITEPGQGPHPAEGGRVGPYRLIRDIGRGGMGTVYLAVRSDDTFQKRVAIKVLKRGMDTDAIVRRFRHERQILASLEHPFIAGVLDGGTTAAGLLIFARTRPFPPTRDADLAGAERDYAASVAILDAMNKARPLQGSDLTTYENHKKALEKIRSERAGGAAGASAGR